MPQYIHIFQMAKVASRSWLKLLHAARPEDTISNFHVTSGHRIEIDDALFQKPASEQSIKYNALPGPAAPDMSIRVQLDGQSWKGPRSKIITGVRDPLARALSVAGYFTNYLGYKNYPVTIRDRGTPENLARLFRTALSLARMRKPPPPDDILLAVLSEMILLSKVWFEEELKPTFGLDIADLRFDFDRASLVITGEHDLFAYRFEDAVDPSRVPLMLAAASDFFETELTCFPTDTSVENRYRKFFDMFKAALVLTEEELEWFYDGAAMSVFYSAEEISAMKSKWHAQLVEPQP